MCEASRNETIKHQPSVFLRATGAGSTGGGAIVSAVSGWAIPITTHTLTTAFFEGFRTPAEHSTNKRHAQLAGVRKPPEKETAGEGTKGRAAFGVSAGTEGRFLIQPEGYGTKIAK